MSTQHTSNASTDQRLFPSWVPYVFFALTTVIFFRGHLFGNLFFWDDFVEYVYPVRAFAAQQMAMGKLPFWNPYSFGGMPFLADIQTALFYPPNLILDLLAGGGPYPIGALQFLIIAHFFIAQCTMYGFTRRLELSAPASMIASVGYGFSAPLVLHAFHPMQVEHLAWFPLIAMLLYTAVTKRSIVHGVSGGLVLGMTMLSGSPQMTLYMAFILGLFMVWTAATSLNREISVVKDVLMRLGTGTLVLAIGFGTFCVQYLPVKEIAALSERAEMTYEKASVGSLELSQILTTTVPKAFGSISPDAKNKAPFFLHERDYYLYWDTAFYFGVVTFILGLLGAIAARRNSVVVFMIVISAFACLFALGSNGFVFPVFFQLPFFNALRIPARMMFVVAFAFSVLSAYGFDWLWSQSKQRSSGSVPTILWALAIPLVLALAVSTGLGVNAPAEQIQSAVQGYGGMALFMVMLTGMVALLFARGAMSATIAVAGLCILSYADLMNAHGDFNAGKVNPVKDSQSMLSPSLRDVLLPKKPDDVFRVSMRAPGVIALKRNQGMTDKVMLYEGYNQLLLAKRHPAVNDAKTRLDVLGVRYEIRTDSVRGGAGFVQRPDCLPNAYMVYATKLAGEGDMKSVMNSVTDFRRAAVVEDAAAVLHDSSVDSSWSVRCTEYNENDATYTVQTAKRGLAVFNEIWYPSWTVRIDGVQAPVVRVNTCQRGVIVPAGSHTVTWSFMSESFATGFRISLGTLVFAVALLVINQITALRRKQA